MKRAVPMSPSNSTWPCSPDTTIVNTLSNAEVHVWCAWLDDPRFSSGAFESNLSPDERDRAGRFKFERDRNRYIAARGLLRSILSLYLDIPPRELAFDYGPNGKPELATTLDKENLRFNLSHSEGVALFAFARAKQLGIDIESIRQDYEWSAIAERFFSPDEVSAIRALPTTIQPQAFFTCWTRKEAYVKAKGEGLTLALNSFDVSPASREPAQRLKIPNDPQEASRWSLYDISPGPSYAAALAVEGHDWQVKCWRWSKAHQP